MKKLNAKAELLRGDGCHIEELFWISPMVDSSRLEGFLEDMDEEDLRDILPGLDIEEGDIADQLDALGITGIIAECRHHVKRNICFDKDGNYRSSFRSLGVTMSFYIYAETLEELIDLAIATETKFNDEEIEDAKQKQATS